VSDETPLEPDCAKVLDNLYLFLDNEMEEATWDDVHAHIADCGPCLSEFDLERMLKELVARSCAERAPEPLRQRVMYSIRSVQVEIHTTRE